MNAIQPLDPSVTVYQADQSPVVVYLATRLKSVQGRRTMRQALNTIAVLLGAPEVLPDPALSIPWHALRYQHTAALAARLSETYAPATTNKMMSALRGVLKEAWRLGQMDAEDYQRAVDIQQEKLKAQDAAAGRALTAGEVLALVQTCKADRRSAGQRDAALIGVLYFGLRRAEVVALNLSDYRRDTGALFVKGSKGRDRTIYLTGGARMALDVWLIERGLDAGPLFTRIRRWDAKTADRLTTQAIYTILKERALQAGVADFSPHDFRRTFVGELLERGADIATVAKLAGHASVKTTAGYDRRGEESKKKAAELLHYPF
ncbi:MAG: tyrosine-type recombinase/integrase [Chloroflexota bacterium]